METEEQKAVKLAVVLLKMAREDLEFQPDADDILLAAIDNFIEKYDA